MSDDHIYGKSIIEDIERMLDRLPRAERVQMLIGHQMTWEPPLEPFDAEEVKKLGSYRDPAQTKYKKGAQDE